MGKERRGQIGPRIRILRIQGGSTFKRLHGVGELLLSIEGIAQTQPCFRGCGIGGERTEEESLGIRGPAQFGGAEPFEIRDAPVLGFGLLQEGQRGGVGAFVIVPFGRKLDQQGMAAVFAQTGFDGLGRFVGKVHCAVRQRQEGKGLRVLRLRLADLLEGQGRFGKPPGVVGNQTFEKRNSGQVGIARIGPIDKNQGRVELALAEEKQRQIVRGQRIFGVFLQNIKPNRPGFFLPAGLEMDHTQVVCGIGRTRCGRKGLLEKGFGRLDSSFLQFSQPAAVEVRSLAMATVPFQHL